MNIAEMHFLVDEDISKAITNGSAWRTMARAQASKEYISLLEEEAQKNNLELEVGDISASGLITINLVRV